MLNEPVFDWKEECQCDVLPHDGRPNDCTKHGANAKPQPRRVISVRRTRSLHDASSGDAILNKIEGLVNEARVKGDLASRQLGALRWAVAKCRSIMTELREEFESL